MRALMMTDFNRLQLVDVPEPELERPDDVLVEVRASGVCGSDLHGYTGKTGRRAAPLIMGHEVAGVVLAAGPEAKGVTAGTRVAINPIDRAGPKRRLMGMDAPGGYAERVIWPARNLYRLPEEVSFAAGSLAEPLAVAIHAVDRAPLGGAEVAVVVGAGPIGLLVAAVLRHRGVPRVVVTDLSEVRLRVARRLGFSAMPVGEDPLEALQAVSGGRSADVAFEAVGVGAAVAQAHAMTRDGGAIVWIGNNLRLIELDMQDVVTRELDVRGSYGMTGGDFELALAAGSQRHRRRPAHQSPGAPGRGPDPVRRVAGIAGRDQVRVRSLRHTCLRAGESPGALRRSPRSRLRRATRCAL